MQSLSLEAKDEPPLWLPAPVNEVTEILTLAICQEDGTEVSIRTDLFLTRMHTPSFFVSEQVVLADQL